MLGFLGASKQQGHKRRIKIGYNHRCMTTSNSLLWVIVVVSSECNMFYDIICYLPFLTSVHRPSPFDILLSLFIIYKLILAINKILVTKEELEYTKGVIRIRNSKKERLHNGQKKKSTKGHTTIHKTWTHKTKHGVKLNTNQSVNDSRK
jgi:hypothetical protein